MEMHPSTVIHFIMIYGKTMHEKCENISIVHSQFKVAAFFSSVSYWIILLLNASTHLFQFRDFIVLLKHKEPVF